MADLEPALTEEEWEELLSGKQVKIVRGDPDDRFTPRIYAEEGYGILILDDWGQAAKAGSAAEMKALAAVCLHGQDFGFTWERVDELRSVAENLPYIQGFSDGDRDSLVNFADQIASFLPPRDDG